MKGVIPLLLLLVYSLPLFGQEKIEIVCGPYLQNVTENEATIVWITNRNAVSWVELAPNDGSHFYAAERPRFYDHFAGHKQIGMLHRITLKGLDGNTRYRYRIFSQEVLENNYGYTNFGKTASSRVFKAEPYGFKTLDPATHEVAFAVVNDIHEDTGLLNDLLCQTDLEKTDFIVFNGDMVNHVESEKQILDRVLSPAVKSFASGQQFYFVRGNHETRGIFAREYMRYFKTPSGMPYYGFRYGPAYFVVLDAGEDKPDSDIQYFGLGVWDEYREEQAQWLKRIIETEQFKTAVFKIVLMHIPPTQNMWYGAVRAKEIFVPLLNQAGVNLMISGHLHRYYYVSDADECNFPILINGRKQIVQVWITEKSMKIIVKDTAGKVLETIKF